MVWTAKSAKAIDVGLCSVNRSSTALGRITHRCLGNSRTLSAYSQMLAASPRCARGTGGVTRRSRRAQRFPGSDQKVHSVLAVVSARSECALPKLLYVSRKALRPDSAARERPLYATRVPNLQRDVPDPPAIGTRLFAFEKCRDVCKQFVATRLAHHTLFLPRSTMRAAFQSTNLTAPLRRLTYSAEPANVALCTGIRPLEIR